MTAPEVLDGSARADRGLHKPRQPQRERYGTGLSFLFEHRWVLDIDAGRRSGSETVFNGADLFMVTTGGDAYSEFLGNGTRSFLNPYFGFRVGYARVDFGNAAALGVDPGLEVVHLQHFIIEGQISGFGLLGAPKGPIVGVQPSLTARFAF